MKEARPASGSKAPKPRPPAPKLDYSEEITDEQFAKIKRAHRDLNGSGVIRGGVSGEGLFPEA
jgi:hypothetical protein